MKSRSYTHVAMTVFRVLPSIDETVVGVRTVRKVDLINCIIFVLICPKLWTPQGDQIYKPTNKQTDRLTGFRKVTIKHTLFRENRKESEGDREYENSIIRVRGEG